MKPFLISQVPVFAPDSLGRDDLDYLKAAARDSDNQCVQEVAGRLHIQVSSNPDENLYLYGTSLLRQLFEAVQEMEASAFTIDLDPKPAVERIREYELPFGVEVRAGVGVSGVGSDLAEQFEVPEGEPETDCSPGEVAADAVESFLVALAANGFDLGTPAFEEAFQATVESIGYNLL